MLGFGKRNSSGVDITSSNNDFFYLRRGFFGILEDCKKWRHQRNDAELKDNFGAFLA